MGSGGHFDTLRPLQLNIYHANKDSQVHACSVRVCAVLSVLSRREILRPLVLSVFLFAFFESAVPHAAPMTGRETKKRNVWPKGASVNYVTRLMDGGSRFRVTRY